MVLGFTLAVGIYSIRYASEMPWIDMVHEIVQAITILTFLLFLPKILGAKSTMVVFVSVSILRIIRKRIFVKDLSEIEKVGTDSAHIHVSVQYF